MELRVQGGRVATDWASVGVLKERGQRAEGSGHPGVTGQTGAASRCDCALQHEGLVEEAKSRLLQPRGGSLG